MLQNDACHESGFAKVCLQEGRERRGGEGKGEGSGF